LMIPASDAVSAWLQEKTLTFTAVNGHYHLEAADRAAANAMIDALRSRNVEIESLTVKRRSLETVFIDKIENENA
jgi:hypothetical protein